KTSDGNSVPFNSCSNNTSGSRSFSHVVAWVSRERIEFKFQLATLNINPHSNVHGRSRNLRFPGKWGMGGALQEGSRLFASDCRSLSSFRPWVTCAGASSRKHAQSSGDESPKWRFALIRFAARKRPRLVSARFLR